MQGLRSKNTFAADTFATAAARRRSAALLELAVTAFLLAAIIATALALGIDFARAATVYAAEPDVGLVLALLVAAVAVMVALSAAAVRFASRSRR